MAAPSHSGSQEFTTRHFRDSDLPAALAFWEHESGWGTITAEQWRKWYRDTPYGDSHIVVATDSDDALVGQIVFTPSMIRVGGDEFKAYRVSTPILARSLRDVPIRSANHPLRTMFSLALQHSVESGASVVYATPWEKWLPLIQLAARRGVVPGRTIVSLIPCSGIPREYWQASKQGGAQLHAALIEEFTAEHSSLWEKAVDDFPLGASIVRTRESLRFKYNAAICLEVRAPEDRELIGFLAIRKETGLVMELVTRRPEDIRPVIEAATKWLDALDPGVPFKSVQFMEWPLLSPVREIPGCVEVPFNFGFFAVITDGRVSDDAMDLRRWYITPGD
jgi:hypothetical protein